MCCCDKADIHFDGRSGPDLLEFTLLSQAQQPIEIPRPSHPSPELFLLSC